MAGSLYTNGDTCYLKYYIIVDGVRVHKSFKLCQRSDVNDWWKKKNRKWGYSSAVRELQRVTMDKIKADMKAAESAALALTQPPTLGEMRITDFWGQRYLPYNEEVIPLTGKPRKKASTMRGYKQIWNQHLKIHCGTRTLQQYEPNHGTQLLQSLTGTQRKSTLKHIRAVGSAIFRLAVVEQRIKVNPWHDVVMPDDAIDSEETEHYTMEEAENIISALVDHVDAQLVLALACFLGLGPAEIGGLQWGDIDMDWIHIRRNKVRSKIDTPKTKERTATVPILDQVRVPLELWRMKCADRGLTSDGVFVIADLPNMINRVIKPHIKRGMKKCDRCKRVPDVTGLEWKGLYAGRRGMVTAVVEATGGNYAVAQALARHKKMTTTLNVYKKQITPDAFKAGMNLFQKALNK